MATVMTPSQIIRPHQVRVEEEEEGAEAEEPEDLAVDAGADEAVVVQYHHCGAQSPKANNSAADKSGNAPRAIMIRERTLAMTSRLSLFGISCFNLNKKSC